MRNFRKTKTFKISTFLTLARLEDCIPIPNLEFDILSLADFDNIDNFLEENLEINPKEDAYFISISSVGIGPYLIASAAMQSVITAIPFFSQLQTYGEIGRIDIGTYTRHLTLLLAIIFSTYPVFSALKPIIFNWNFVLACKIISSLITGSMLPIWILDLISNEAVLTDSTSLMLLCDSLTDFPVNFHEIILDLSKFSFLMKFSILVSGILSVFVFAILHFIVTTAEKRVFIVSNKKRSWFLERSLTGIPSIKNNDYIPITLCPGGVVPGLIVGTTFINPVINMLAKNSIFDFTLLAVLVIGFVFLILFNIYYELICIQPKLISEIFQFVGYTIPGVKQGTETTKYLQQLITRICFIGAILIEVLFSLVVCLFVFQFVNWNNLTGTFSVIPVVMELFEWCITCTELNLFYG